MRYTFLISSLRGGGAERVCVNLANCLVQRGHSVEIITLNLYQESYCNFLDPKVKLTNLNVKRTLFCAIKLKKAISLISTAEIISFNRQLSVLLILLNSIFGLNKKVISRNITFLSIAEKRKKGFWHGFIIKVLIKRLYRRSDLFIAQSYAMKSDIIDYLGVNSEKVKVIYNPAFFTEKSAESSSSQCRDYFLFVGGLNDIKQVHYIITAVSILRSKGLDVKLKIVGKGPLIESLTDLAKNLRVDKYVSFEGFQSQLEVFYKNAISTVLTSKFEGFPNVLVESISHGTPIVSFDCKSGPNEIIIDGLNGFLVDDSELAHLVSCMEKAYSFDWNRASIIKSAERFSLTEIVDKYENISKGL